MEDQTSTESTSGELAIMGPTGDLKLTWSRGNADEIEIARKSFDEARKLGFAGYRLGRDETRGEVIREFDPTAERIVMAPPMVGG